MFVFQELKHQAKASNEDFLNKSLGPDKNKAAKQGKASFASDKAAFIALRENGAGGKQRAADAKQYFIGRLGKADAFKINAHRYFPNYSAIDVGVHEGKIAVTFIDKNGKKMDGFNPAIAKNYDAILLPLGDKSIKYTESTLRIVK